MCKCGLEYRVTKSGNIQVQTPPHCTRHYTKYCHTDCKWHPLTWYVSYSSHFSLGLTLPNFSHLYITVPFLLTHRWSYTSTPRVVAKFSFIPYKHHVWTPVQIKREDKQGERQEEVILLRVVAPAGEWKYAHSNTYSTQ